MLAVTYSTSVLAMIAAHLCLDFEEKVMKGRWSEVVGESFTYWWSKLSFAGSFHLLA